MGNISIILKDNIGISTNEFRILNDLAAPGRLWKLLQIHSGSITRYRTMEYIFSPEEFVLFSMVTENILIKWQTHLTLSVRANQYYLLKDNIYITPVIVD